MTLKILLAISLALNLLLLFMAGFLIGKQAAERGLTGPVDKTLKSIWEEFGKNFNSGGVK